MIVKIIICGLLLGVSATVAFPLGSNGIESSIEEELPPKTDVGAFEVRNGYVYLYYERTNKRRTHYIAHELNNQMTLEKVNSLDAFRYANFTNEELTIFVYFEVSPNQMSVANWWRVPSKSQRCAEPTNLKIVRDQMELKLRWTAPVINQTEREIINLETIDLCSVITSYTVFWCPTESERSTSCTGPVNFESVRATPPNDTHAYTIPKDYDNKLLFAVSANSHDSSSGMVWQRRPQEKYSDTRTSNHGLRPYIPPSESNSAKSTAPKASQVLGFERHH